MNLKVMAIVMAGGEGSRLNPLTAMRSKPAVPFAGRYRIVDFVLSNLINSGINSIYLLVQYKSQSLIEHISHSWVLAPGMADHFVTVVPPQMMEGEKWFQGTADAVVQNIDLIERHAPQLVAVFGADHIYRMDVRQMAAFHRSRGADVTVAALPVPRGTASAFGIIDADDEGRVRGFQEKPAEPAPMPAHPDMAYSSMGNYLFDTGVLLDALRETRARRESDFGRDVIPRLIGSHRVYAYNFADNHIPGIRTYEEPSYWRDVGTLDAYFAANMDLLGREPRLNLFNPRWPIGSSNYQGPVSRIVEGKLNNCLIGAGTLIKGGEVSNSIIRREVVIEEDTLIEDCIIMDYTVIRRGARLRRAIVDRYNVVEAGARIGYDLHADGQRYFVTESGLVVVPKGHASPEIERY
ncbi:MAG: glucose-1-phosphate adenylyltransferase [Sulfuricella sp.]